MSASVIAAQQDDMGAFQQRQMQQEADQMANGDDPIFFNVPYIKTTKPASSADKQTKLMMATSTPTQHKRSSSEQDCSATKRVKLSPEDKERKRQGSPSPIDDYVT